MLALVNAIFHDAFAEYEPLVAHRPQTTSGPSIEFLWTPAEPDDEGDLYQDRMRLSSRTL